MTYHDVRTNPWFSPPSLQYVSRINPPSVQHNACYGMHWHQDRPFDPPADLYGATHSGLPHAGPRPALDYMENPPYDDEDLGPDYYDYHPESNPPLYWHPGGSHRYHGRLYRGSGYWGRYPDTPPEDFHPGSGVPWGRGYHPGGGYRSNPGFRNGDVVTWSEDGLDADYGPKGQVMRVLYPTHGFGDEPAVAVVSKSRKTGIERERVVPVWAVQRSAASNPVEFHPGGSHTFRGRRYYGSGRLHHHGRSPSRYHPGGGVPYRGGYHPGGGHYERNPYGTELWEDVELPGVWNKRYGRYDDDVDESLIAIGDYELNPYSLRGDDPELPGVWHERYGDDEDDYVGGSLAEIGAFQFNPRQRRNPHRNYCVPDGSGGQDCFASNPCGGCGGCGGCGSNPYDTGETMSLYGREVPIMSSKAGRYHHVRVGEPGDFERIRSKTLSGPKGIKARIGVSRTAGPRGGRTRVQSYLFDADMYTPEDVARWIEGHDVEEPLLFERSPRKATKRRMAVGPKKKAPKKRKATPKKKAPKRKPTKRKRKVAANRGPRNHKPGCGCFACVRRRAA